MSMKDQICIGIIGCGKIAVTRHIPEYAENPNVRLVGYYDFVPARAAALAEQYGGQTYDSVDVLLSDPSIDAVSICTANSTHAELTVRALQAGKHVLCEKPMAITEVECRAMCEAAANTEKKLMIAQNQRYMSVHVRARELLESGILGRVLTFQTTFGHSGPDNWSVDKGTGNWFFSKSKGGFGALADLAVHKIDLIQYLLASPIVEVKAMLGTLDKCKPDGSPAEVEDNAQLLCRAESGMTGTVTASWTRYGEEDNSTVICGTNGVMKIDPATDTIQVELDNRDRIVYHVAKQNKSGVMDAFAACILRDEEPPVSGESVLTAMQVIFAAVQSAKEPGTVVS